LEINLTPSQVAQFEAYSDLLLAWSQRMNITAVLEPQKIESRHFLDSLTCILATGNLNGLSMIDVGSGGGFPGLPLKIAFPGLKLVLLESVGKKTEFLQVVVDTLHLEYVQVINQRAEVLGQDPKHRESYDWAAARAVSKLRVLAEYLLPFCKIGGHMLAQKGRNLALELDNAQNAVTILGGERYQIFQAPPFQDSQDSKIIVVKKVRKTPLKYPRRPGIPAKRPL